MPRGQRGTAAEGKCPQVRTDAAVGSTAPCPTCGAERKVVSFDRKEGPVAFIPSHTTGQASRGGEGAAPARKSRKGTGRKAPAKAAAKSRRKASSAKSRKRKARA
jgi:hypothetical protein